MENHDRATAAEEPQQAGHACWISAVTRRYQVGGLFLHEVLFGVLILAYAFSGGAQKKSLPFEALYFGLVIAAFPVLCFRCTDDWRRLDNKWFFLLLVGAWLLFFQFFGNSTFGYVDTPSLFHWMYNAYSSESPAADDGHGLLIPFVVMALFWWKRKELLAQPHSVWWPGILLVGFAVAIHVFGYVVQQPRISIVALFAGIYGIMGMAWGPNWLRASFFPFFLVVFMVPLGSLTEPATFPLRLMVSKCVAIICQYVLAIDVQSVGTSLVRVPSNYQYDVAAACSGIRSLMAIAAISIIYAFVAFRSWNRRAILIALAVPLAFIGNTFRMMVIVLAAEFGGQSAGNKAHESWVWSLMPYVPAIFGLMMLGRWLEKGESASTSDGEKNAT